MSELFGITPDIIVVDDEAMNRMIAKKMLSGHFMIREASSGEEALSLVAQKRPDLILLDVHMPGMDGHDVINILKRNPGTKDIPVVLATADNDRETEVIGLKEGASDFIPKPFSKDILIQRISRIIELSFLQNNLKEEVARQTAKAEERSRKIERMSIQIVYTLANAIDAKDQYSQGHSIRVSQYSVLIAQALGWDEERIRNLRYAALLHDIGKILIPDMILNNPKKLSENEFEIVKKHTTSGGDMLKTSLMISGAEDVARHHHERFDGIGYPNGLEGNDISTEARIVCIADAYDAMKSRRSFRKSYDEEYIKDELIRGKGKQFDPYLVDVFLGLIDSGVTEAAAQNTLYTTEEGMEASSVLLKTVMESFVIQSAQDEIDVTTGLLSRTSGESAIAKASQDVPGCFIFFDVDNLKKINDIYGHKAGDKVLKLMGDTLLNNSDNAVCCRMGGDEFLMFIREADKAVAETRVQKVIEEFLDKKNQDVEISASSLSAGLVLSTPEETYIDIYNKADKALYHVKQNGKEGYYFYQDVAEDETGGTVDIGRLVKSIRNSGSYEGAMDVEFRQFTKLFEYIANLEKRYEHSFKLVMITMKLPEEQNIVSETIDKSITCMEQCIRKNIRNVDIVTRYSNIQLLVILLEASDEGVVTVMERVFSEYYEMGGEDCIKAEYEIADTNSFKIG